MTAAAADAAGVSMAGLVLALLSMLANGTFPIFGKFCKPPPDDVLYSSCTAMGVLFSSLIAALLAPADSDGDRTIGWTWAGALGGVLLVLAIVNSFIAMSLSGLATAQATWSCAAIVVSVLWGVLGPSRGGAGPGAPVKGSGMTVLAVVLLLAGVLVINLKDRLANSLCAKGEVPSGGETELSSGSGHSSEEAEADISPAPELENPPSQTAGESIAAEEREEEQGGGMKGRAALGLVPALLVGVSGGSVLVPMSFVDKSLQGLPVLLSFGVAAGASGAVMGLGYWVCCRGESLSLSRGSVLRRELRPSVVLMGLLSGVVWNLGNICQVVAMMNLNMPYGISYPVFQCAFIVGGLWGIFVFREVTDAREIAIFFGGVAVVAAGVVMLGMYGPGAT